MNIGFRMLVTLVRERNWRLDQERTINITYCHDSYFHVECQVCSYLLHKK